MSRKRTKFDRQIECRRRVIGFVSNVFNDAIIDKRTHSEILASLHGQYRPDTKRLTIAQREYVRGYETARFDDIYRNHVAWGFKPCGVFCATFEDVQSKYHDEIVADRCNGFHYWLGTNGEKSY